MIHTCHLHFALRECPHLTIYDRVFCIGRRQAETQSARKTLESPGKEAWSWRARHSGKFSSPFWLGHPWLRLRRCQVRVVSIYLIFWITTGSVFFNGRFDLTSRPSFQAFHTATQATPGDSPENRPLFGLPGQWDDWNVRKPWLHTGLDIGYFFLPFCSFIIFVTVICRPIIQLLLSNIWRRHVKCFFRGRGHPSRVT